MKKDEITCYFSGNIGTAVKKLSDGFFDEIQEIRLRVNRPTAVSVKNNIRYITAEGQLTYNPDFGVIADYRDLQKTFEAICQYSVHSFQHEITEGFVTVKGGHRAGICGTSVIRENSVENIKNISSINFRIAREIKGCADELCNKVFGAGLCNFLIAGSPGSGKTTRLRDISRMLGGRYKTAGIDERGELAAVMNGIPQNDVGINTDVFDGYSKPLGIMTAIRVMSPQIIICDEIGSEEDFNALYQASNSGVYVAASIHSFDMDELRRKGIALDMFKSIAVLSNCENLGQISFLSKEAVENA